MKTNILWILVLAYSFCIGHISSNHEDNFNVEDLDLWPLITPMLGGNLISKECILASLEYVTLLSESFQFISMGQPSALNETHRNALKRLDSGGPLPFFEEGILMDTRKTDICTERLVRDLLMKNHNISCYTLPKEKRVFDVPYHTPGSPGMIHMIWFYMILYSCIPDQEFNLRIRKCMQKSWWLKILSQLHQMDIFEIWKIWGNNVRKNNSVQWKAVLP